MIDDQKRFTLRINAKLLEQIKREAQKEKRATGKQIEYLLDVAMNKKN